MQITGNSEDARPTRSGHVALVGRPNVGKSTLMNALVGEKLSIVTPRAQTTRERVFGILSGDDVQVIFVDTPGLLEPKYRLQKAMLETALAAIADADVVLLLLDATRPQEVPSVDVVEVLRSKGSALVVGINKTDSAAAKNIEQLRSWTREQLNATVVEVSALNGEGLDGLRRALVERLPESPFLYPEEDLAVQSMRFFVEELIRETIFEQYQEEVPYSTVVRVEEFKENRQPIYIRATVYVERNSQKPIILGRGGSSIRELGRASRSKIEQFVGAPVYLDLWVKALPGWRNKAAALKFLGYTVPDADAH